MPHLESTWISSQLRLSWTNKISADFHSQILYGHLFTFLVLWAAVPGIGLRPHVPQGGPWTLKYILPDSQLAHVGVGPARFASLPFLQAWMWLLL